MAFGTALISYWLDDDNVQIVIKGDGPARRLNLKKNANMALYNFLRADLLVSHEPKEEATLGDTVKEIHQRTPAQPSNVNDDIPATWP